MSQKQVGTRLPSDDADTLERYVSEHDVSKAEALRRAVRQLDDEPDWVWRGTLVAGFVFLILAEAGILSGLLVVPTGLVLIAGLFWSYLR